MARRVEAFLVAGLTALAWSGVARAEGGACVEAVSGWAERCAKSEGIELSPKHCPPGRVVVRAAELDVEIGPARPESFRRIGELGLSPIGEFADWSKEPEPRRRALDAVSACVRRDPSLLAVPQPSVEPERTSRPAPSPLRLPWILLAALIATAVACGARLRDRRALRVALALLGACALTFAVRWLLLPRAFFHQNGHGALWIAQALDEQPGLSSYGPGFGELFGWAARASGAEPERGVVLVHAILGAAVPALAWLVARGVGASLLASTAVALAVALDPLLARLAHSESYFSTIATLGFAAAAVLASAGPRLRSLSFVAGTIAAGLFVAQAARVHPIGWMALALLPAVVLVGPGSVRRRLITTAVAGIGIAAVVAATTGAELVSVLRGTLGRQWLPHASPRAIVLWQGVAPWMFAIAVALGAALRSWRGALLALLAVGAFTVMWLTNLLAEPNLAVGRAYDRMFWPVFVALVAAWLARRARTRRAERVAAAAIAIAGVVAALLGFRALTTLPTDAREASWALEWRRTLPAGARVVYVERAGKHIFTLPLYDGVTAARGFSVTVGGALPDLRELSGPIYYYRSSVCSTEEARAVCQALERSLPLEPVAERELPALPSMRWHPYADGPVRVALLRRP